VASVLGDIRSSAPNAQILLVGYPAILPATGNGCWPQMPFTYTDAPYLRAKEVELNSTLADVAAANGAQYVNTYTPSTGHNACTPEGRRWIEPFVPASPAAPAHPNAAGEAAMATLVAAAMSSAGG
jgi:hypothetical protein